MKNRAWVVKKGNDYYSGGKHQSFYCKSLTFAKMFTSRESARNWVREGIISGIPKGSEKVVKVTEVAGKWQEC
jgi:hypothetical protein